MKPKSNFDRLRAFLEGVWSDGHEELIHAQLQGKATGLWPGEVDSDGFLEYYRSLSRLLKDIRFEFTNWHEDDDYLWVSWVIHGRHWKDEAREIKWPGAATVRFEDDKIAEVHNYQDYMALFSQLELLPEQAFEDSLAGVNLVDKERPSLNKVSLEAEFLWPGFRRVKSEDGEMFLPCTQRQLALMKTDSGFTLPSEEQLRVLSQSGTYSFVFVDEEDSILEADDSFASLVDRLPRSLPGLLFHQMLYPEDQTEEARLFAELVQGKRGEYRHEARLMRGQTVVWVQLSTAILRKGDGEPLLVRAVQESSRIEDLVAFQETERKMLSMELHDGVAQDLATVWIYLQTGRHKLEPTSQLMDRCLQLVEKMSGELRRRMKDLRSPILEGTSLSVALKGLVSRTSRGTDIAISLEVEADCLELLDQTLSLLVYRVVQEALQNMSRHSHAEKGWVQLKLEGSRLRGRIADDGRGFDLTEASAKGRMGLLGMRDRCELAGGSLEVRSAPGEGAEVSFEIPLSGLRLPQVSEEP